MILLGKNDASIASTDFCWVSPVATGLIEDTQLCSAYYVFTQDDKSYVRGLSVVLLQLLRQKSPALRNGPIFSELSAELVELQACLQVPKIPAYLERSRTRAFEKVYRRVVGLFDESDVVYIVLDRVDQCENLRRGIDHRKLLLKMLVRMVEEARCRLKVLAVIKGDQWDIEQSSRQDELGAKLKDRVIVHTEVQKPIYE